MWYRTKTAGVYNFWTVNGDGVSSPNGASSLIPPMQAFWVRANAGGGTLNNSLYNKDIQIQGNWIDLKTSSGFVPGTGTVYFNGSTAQTINIAGNFAEPFYNLAINNSSTGVSLTGAGQVSVSNNIILTNGIFNTNSTNYISLTSSSPSVAIGGKLPLLEIVQR